MSSIRSNTAAFAVALAVSLPAAGPAFAEAADQLKLEEVTVTARKVVENLMTVPIAITAMSSRDLEATNVKGLSDIMTMTPSFHFENQTGGGSGRNDRSFNSLTFRGLYLNSNLGTAAGGQLFIDGAPVIGAQPPSVVDMARVEVLKGPQSAYFGRSTFVGAINFVTRDPGEDFKTKLSVEGSRWGSYDLAASIEGPIVSDKLAARFTARSYERGGYVTNAAAPGDTKLGKQHTSSFATSIVWKPSDSVKVKTFLSFFEDQDGPPAQAALKSTEFNGRIDANGNCVSFAQAPAGTAALGQVASSRASFGYWCGEMPDSDKVPASIYSGNYESFSNQRTYNALYKPPASWTVLKPTFQTGGGLHREALQGDVRIDWEFGGGYTFSSLSAYHNDKMMSVVDLVFRDGSKVPNPLFGAPPFNATSTPDFVFLLGVQTKQRDYSQELRITSPQNQSLRWTFGLNYLNAFSPGGPVWGMSPLGPLFASGVTEASVKTPAVFAAGYFDFAQALTLSVEARYQEDKISQTPKIDGSGNVVTGPGATPLKATFDSFSPRVSLDWKYAPSSVAYILYSKGYRPGGFNSSLVTSSAAAVAVLRSIVPNASVAYEEEQLDNFEVGLKSTWFDGRARTTVTIYKDKWKNGQVGNTIPVAVGGTSNLFNIVVNNGTADLKGIEFEGGLQVTRGLRLSGTFAINDSEVTSYGVGPAGTGAACSDCNFVYGAYTGVIGRQLPGTPRVTGSLAADYTAPLTGTVSWYTRADVLHQGKRYVDFAGATWIGASNKVNARVGLRSEKWSVEAFGTNLTNDQTMASAYLGIDLFTFLFPQQKNEIRLAPAIPRAFGIRASYEF